MNPNQPSRIHMPAGLRRRTLASFQPQRTGGDGSRRIVPGVLLLLLTGLLSLSGCNETFEPWIENDRYHFSIYGYLDSSADTQWVRVMPVREDFLLDPEQPIDATVTLEHIETGETVVMSDSLFTYPHGVYAYNYWTTMKLKPEQTYRVVVTRSDEAASQATTTLPADFPTPSVRIHFTSGIPNEAFVFIEDVEQLADVQTIYFARYAETNEEYIVARSHLKDSVRTATGDLLIVMDPAEDYQYVGTFFQLIPPVAINHFLRPDSRYEPHIFIAAAGPDYQYFPNIHEHVFALPEGVSNIENGVGYLAGIVSKTIPYKNCHEEGSVAVIPCNEQATPPW
ncbi:MAG: hypothetical protein WD355_09240 [Balneolaceae bacterium]